MYFGISPSSSSFGSSCSTTSAMSIDIKRSNSSDPTSPSCAFPSWPRRSSLSGIAEEPTSFISDDDLFPSVFDDESGDCSPLASPHRGTSPTATTRNGEVISGSVLRHLLALQQQQNQCYLPSTKSKKKRSSKKSRASSVTKPMSVIAEVTEQGRENE